MFKRPHLITYSGLMFMAIATMFAISIAQIDPGGISTNKIGIGFLMMAMVLIAGVSEILISPQPERDIDQVDQTDMHTWALISSAQSCLWVGVVAAVATEFGSFLAIGGGVIGLVIYWLNIGWHYHFREVGEMDRRRYILLILNILIFLLGGIGILTANSGSGG